MVVSQPKLCIFGQKFSDRTNFLTAQNLGFPAPWHDATACVV